MKLRRRTCRVVVTHAQTGARTFHPHVNLGTSVAARRRSAAWVCAFSHEDDGNAGVVARLPTRKDVDHSEGVRKVAIRRREVPCGH